MILSLGPERGPPGDFERKFMAYSIWVVPEASFTIGGGESLDGVTQGDGTHLLGETITFDGGGWTEVFIADNDDDFDDNDGNQRLDFAQTIFGTSYANNTAVEAEYTLILTDGTNTYTLIAFNVNEPGHTPAYGTIEGVAFVGDPPPIGVPLTVVDTAEGPGGTGEPPVPNPDIYVPPCFTPGTLIRTACGPRPVEDLRPGDLVWTADAGLHPLRHLLSRTIPPSALAADPALRPVLIRADAFGPGRPARDLRVSPQHRILIADWRAPLHWGAEEVLVPARALVDGARVRIDDVASSVIYLHLVFDRHEIVESEGLLSESYLPGPLTMRGLFADERAAVGRTLPAVRPGVRGTEAGVLMRR